MGSVSASGAKINRTFAHIVSEMSLTQYKFLVYRPIVEKQYHTQGPAAALNISMMVIISGTQPVTESYP